ncbi:MAG: HAMP domain-containing protein [Magnetococcales bacterium]|nr:HAMP domain-containing protein [Magnetococcales bacterium]
MTLGIRGKLILASIALDLFLLLQVGISIELNLEEHLENVVKEQLLSHAKSARVLLSNVSANLTIPEMDRLADDLAHAVADRLTIIDAKGQVLGDSQLEPGQILQVDNHNDRPEVLAAARDGYGLEKRYSDTLQVDMVYLAIPVTIKDQTMVVRVAKSMMEVQQAIRDQRHFLVKALLLAMIMALILTFVALDFMTRTFRKLVHRAKKISRDVREQPLKISSTDEIGGLATSFNTMAEQLDRTVVELAQDRAWMNAILEGMNEGVIALNNNKRITLINQSASKMLNLKASFIGENLDKVVPKEVYERVAGLGENKRYCKVNFDFVTTNQRYLQIFGAMMKNRGCVLVFRDVTEFRHIEQIQRDFVSNVSHELRTPLHSILSNAELLEELIPEEEKQLKKLAIALERNTVRLSRIVSNLLYISKLDANKQALHITDTPLLSIVRQAIAKAAESAGNKQIKISCLVEPSIQFSADSDVLSQVVLFNLIDNAIKYCPEQSVITIRTRKIGKQYRVEVEDNGPGIPPEHQPRIFERFYRVSKHRSSDLGGTGLGLAIVQQWVRKMDGEVGMEPVLPQGCLFWISLPSPPKKN